MLDRLKKITQVPLRTVTADVVGKVFGTAAEHHFTDRVLNVPSPIWRPPFQWKRFEPAEGERYIETLRREGVVVLPPLLNRAELQEIHRDLEVEFARPSPDNMQFKVTGQYYFSIQPL